MMAGCQIERGQQGLQWELRKEYRLFRSMEGEEAIKEGTDEVIVISKARQDDTISQARAQ